MENAPFLTTLFALLIYNLFPPLRTVGLVSKTRCLLIMEYIYILPTLLLQALSGCWVSQESAKQYRLQS
ncbi:hypothetical protein F5B17DRAFT_407567 [Nemania serpens]|nr:hypothetical protein F5B17DRAFT_407567 [Nemania serpens]